jgi:hypothetical protein
VERAQADQLNRQCFCLTLDKKALAHSLEKEIGSTLSRLLSDQHQSLPSDSPVFVSQMDVARMKQTVRAIETAAQLPGQRDVVRPWAPAIARLDPGPAGALYGL